jgi:hypothetical protein
VTCASVGCSVGQPAVRTAEQIESTRWPVLLTSVEQVAEVVLDAADLLLFGIQNENDQGCCCD